MSTCRFRSAARRGFAIQFSKFAATAALAASAVITFAPGVRAQSLPSDPRASCVVSSSLFATWFQKGSVSLNGVAEPANSVAFSDQPNCPFYQWSEQMFLWLTSPAPSIYGGGGEIFTSSTFFDVSPPDANGVRTFLPHVANVIRPLFVRNVQKGPKKLPLIFDTSGRLLQVEAPLPGVSLPRIMDNAGKLVDVAHALRGAEGALVLQNSANETIQRRAQISTFSLNLNQASHPTTALTVRKFVVDKIPIFVDAAGNVVDVEQGQAGGDDVLQAQNGSLVYYATTVNDVYAYFLTGVKDHAITPGTLFPTTMADLNQITTFAAAHGRTFPDPAALAVEIKSSWIEAASLPNSDGYIKMMAVVPTYDKSNPTNWTINGEKTIQLAMVGMHVVGSTKGHPEMIWATFEHVGNAPRGAFSYVNSNGGITNVAQDSGGPWLFSATNAPAPFNVSHMGEAFPSLAIEAKQSFTISPSNTVHWKAFGAASNVSPNPIDGSAAASNSEIISINNSVRGMLIPNDIRANYVMSGATWTIGGLSPTDANQVGTSLLANSTMETYQQGTDTLAHNTLNCFSCHQDGNPGNPATTDVSHIFSGLKPLF